MGLKKWMSKRRELKESQQRFGELSEEEIQELHDSEKSAYLEIAKKQITYRGKINAYKDFPVTGIEKQEIDIENEEKEEDDEINENEESELDEETIEVRP